SRTNFSRHFLSYKNTITNESSNLEKSNNNNSSLEELYDDYLDEFNNDNITHENYKSLTKASLSSIATVSLQILAKRKKAILFIEKVNQTKAEYRDIWKKIKSQRLNT
ncbi:25472_t:CDS:1, partial [Racocetra persica]